MWRSAPHGAYARLAGRGVYHRRMATSWGRLLVLVLVLADCGPKVSGSKIDGGGGDDASTTDGPPLPHTLQALTVTPTNPIVQVDLNMPATQDFAVTGSYMDGTTDDLTAQVAWDVMNPAVGAMSGATLQIPAFAAAGAQVSLITASFGGLTGQAQITSSRIAARARPRTSSSSCRTRMARARRPSPSISGRRSRRSTCSS